MKNVVANFTLGDQPELQADFSISEQEPLVAEFEVDVFEKRHNKLINRELPDQHPISAITGLQDALDSIDAGIGDFAQEVNDSITSVRNALKLEEDNRKLADEQLESSINAEAQARISADANIINTLQSKINRETSERIASDNELRELIESETAQREANDTSINARISQEEAVRKEGDDSLRADLNAEISRSTSKDELLQAQVDQLGQSVSEALENEKNARIDADNDLSDRIDGNLADIEHIESLIPIQASSSNKLADKEFVNSSIATNTANFIGTFNSVAELEAYSGTLTNNDYAFVVGKDSVGNTVYNRYKYNGSEWLFEYALNNSSFTSEQWNAINSGITAVLTEQITTNQSNIAKEVQRATQAEQVLTNTKQNKLTAGVGISIENDVVSSTYDDTEILVDISDLQSDVQDINRILPTKADTTAVSSALALKQDVLTAGRGIEITSSNVINNTLTSAEWGNITGNIADQTDLHSALDTKQNVITGAASTITSSNLTASRALVSDSSGKVAISAVTSTELGYLDGVTSSVQTQLNAKQDIATSVNYKNITNCITEIPQDIKLELADGTLTLKAGSKVYVPNGFEADGSNRFDVITIAEDKSYRWDNTGSGFVMVYLNGNLTVSSTGSETVSSLTPAKTFKIFYNTTDNKCYFDGATSLLQVSFPIARFTATGAITSIDQVFNGFGYIGSTVFALPGVKVLIPNGRNADGTLKNKFYTNDSVKTMNTNPSWGVNVCSAYFGDLTLYGGGEFDFFLAIDSITKYTYKNLYLDTVTGRNNAWCRIASFNPDANGKITSFTPKTAFHAVDYNDYKNADDQNVKLTGNQIIAGEKTFNGILRLNSTYNAPYRIINKDITIDTVPSENKYSQFRIDDKNLDWVAYTGYAQRKDGNRFFSMNVRKPDKSSDASIQVGYRPNGTIFTYCPTPLSTSNTAEIATTAWVNTKLSSVASVPNYSAGVSVAADFTAAYNGFLKVSISSNYPTIDITVNDVKIVYFRFEHHYTDQVTYLIPIAKGDVVTLRGSSKGGLSAVFFPTKGA